MADDMTNPADASRHYQDAMQAQLGERVTNLGRRQTDLESEMRSGFKQMETAVASLANETRNSIASLSTAINERNKPQWQALGVALTFATILGGLAYWPINTATTDLKSAVGDMAKTMTMMSKEMVSRQEMDMRTARAAEDRARLDDSLQAIRTALVPRQEIDRILDGINQRFADQQRQIEDVGQRR